MRSSSPGAGAPDEDAPVCELRAVEGVERAAPDVHDVVRDVDDVRDRAHVGEEEAGAKPLRRGTDDDVPEDPADVARTALEVLDGDVDVLAVDDFGVGGLGRMELATEEGGDLARDADHREQVDAIDGGRHVEHVVADREDVDERRAGLGALGEQHDPRVVGPEAHFVLGEDHPAGGLPAELALVERLVEDRQERTWQRDRDSRPGLEVPRPADDLTSVTLPHVDLADTEPVGVRVCVDGEHAADEEPAEVAVDVRNSDFGYLVHLHRRREQSLGNLIRRRVHRDVLAKP